MNPAETRTAALPAADITQLNLLAERLRRGVKSGQKNLLHNPTDLDDVLQWARAVPNQQEQRLHTLFGAVTQRNFAMEKLREVSVQERREALGPHAITHAVFEDILEGAGTFGRHVHNLHALPRMELAAPRQRKDFRPVGQDGEALAPLPKYNRIADSMQPPPPNCLRVAFSFSRNRYLDVQVDENTMTAMEAVHLLCQDFAHTSMNNLILVFPDGEPLGDKAHLTLRDAGIALQSTLHVIVHV